MKIWWTVIRCLSKDMLNDGEEDGDANPYEWNNRRGRGDEPTAMDTANDCDCDAENDQ